MHMTPCLSYETRYEKVSEEIAVWVFPEIVCLKSPVFTGLVMSSRPISGRYIGATRSRKRWGRYIGCRGVFLEVEGGRTQVGKHSLSTNELEKHRKAQDKRKITSSHQDNVPLKVQTHRVLPEKRVELFFLSDG